MRTASKFLLIALALYALTTMVPVTPAAGQPPWLPRGRAPVLGRVYFGHGTTPAESYARGAAAVMQAQGFRNLLTSQARIHAAEADRLDMENHRRWVQVYFEARKMNRQYRAEQRGQRLTAEQLEQIAAAGRPDPLSPSELDPITGKIHWPILLKADCYEPLRTELEALFAQRAAGDLDVEAYLELDRLIDQMIEQLKTTVCSVPQMDYVAAKRFLRSLAYEVQRDALGT